MAKRRRERDRPKAAPDSIYNPNKRVLLSYASDEEEEEVEQPTGTGAPEAVETVTADYEIAEYPDEDLPPKEPSASSSKHEDEDNEGAEEDGEEDDEGYNHRNDDSLWVRGQRRNMLTGQWAALGSLSYQWEEDECEEEAYDSTEEEAMSYLRSVRHERQGIPEVLKASKDKYSHEEIYESGTGDTRGYIDDGAYVGRVDPEITANSDGERLVEPQEAFTSALKARFLETQRQMHCSPAAESIAALGEKHPITFPAKNNKAHSEWHKILRTSVPQLAQIQAIDEDTVFRLLDHIQKHYLVREKEIVGITSTWIWSLLARLDVGSMDNDQVFLVRGFAKRAILVQISFQDSATAKQLEDVAAGENATDEKTPRHNPEEVDLALDGDESVEAGTQNDGKAGSAAVANNSKARNNTLATLDMIIAIVGDAFGQRDLLEFRQPWQSRETAEGKTALEQG